MVQSLNCPRGRTLNLFHYVNVSLVLGSPELDPALQMGPSIADQRGRITSLDLLAMPFLM